MSDIGMPAIATGAATDVAPIAAGFRVSIESAIVRALWRVMVRVARGVQDRLRPAFYGAMNSNMSIAGAKKSKRGRPPVDSEAVNVRLERPALDALDAWIAKQSEPRPTRPEAIRRLLEKALGAGDAAAFIPIEDVTTENDE